MLQNHESFNLKYLYISVLNTHLKHLNIVVEKSVVQILLDWNTWPGSTLLSNYFVFPWCDFAVLCAAALLNKPGSYSISKGSEICSRDNNFSHIFIPWPSSEIMTQFCEKNEQICNCDNGFHWLFVFKVKKEQPMWWQCYFGITKLRLENHTNFHPAKKLLKLSLQYCLKEHIENEPGLKM